MEAHPEPQRLNLRVCALAGGVGGARLAQGLYAALAPHHLTLLVNTGDDFDHFGLRICPDLDTCTYTLAGMANPATGWGVANDTFHALEMLVRCGGADWFALGDRDLATSVRRTDLLHGGASLSEVTRCLARHLGIQATLLPMCNEPVPTVITTRSGEEVAFQEYFVRRRHADPVASVRFAGVERSRPPAEAEEALAHADAIVLCPSNPFLSLGPILAVPGVRDALQAARAPRVGVSPIVGGQALRGPAADMLAAMGHEVSAVGVAELYRGLLDIYVLDEQDASLAPRIRALGMEPFVAPSIISAPDQRERLARQILDECRAYAAAQRGARA